MRDLTSLFMNIKGFVKPIQNAHILTCMLRYQFTGRLDAYINLIRLDM
jgi:hypothetical protein